MALHCFDIASIKITSVLWVLLVKIKVTPSPLSFNKITSLQVKYFETPDHLAGVSLCFECLF